MFILFNTAADAAKSAIGISGSANLSKKEVPVTLEKLDFGGIKQVLSWYKPYLSAVINKNISPERIIQILTTVITRNPAIKECTTSSVIGAILQSAMLNLDPTPGMGLCYFVPFKNKQNNNAKELQFIIGYQGYIQLARNSGEIKSVAAQVVYENDFFEYEYGLDPKLRHIPTDSDRGAMIKAYAVWKFRDGGEYFEVMTADEIAKAMKVSKSAGSEYSPWKQFKPEMWRKTVIRRSRKYVPISIEVKKQMASDEVVIPIEAFNPATKQLELEMTQGDFDDNAAEVPEERKVEKPKSKKKPPKQSNTETKKDQSDEEKQLMGNLMLNTFQTHGSYLSQDEQKRFNSFYNDSSQWTSERCNEWIEFIMSKVPKNSGQQNLI